MAKVKDILIQGNHGKPICLDIFFNESKPDTSVIIYAHGFNGFKDWGSFDSIAGQFLASGFTFIKFNFSHNGTSPEHPETFVDLEAFGENNYTKQLDDLDTVVTWAKCPTNPYLHSLGPRQLGLIGHSMGGSISIIKTAEDTRIKALATWAAPAECKTPWANWSNQRMMDWKRNGTEYYINSRTNQHMPINYQLHEDYLNHSERLDVIKAASKIKIPWMICHGTEDINVPFKHACELKEMNPAALLCSVSSDHVFGRKHPWNERVQPLPMQQIINKNILFFKQHLDK